MSYISLSEAIPLFAFDLILFASIFISIELFPSNMDTSSKNFELSRIANGITLWKFVLLQMKRNIFLTLFFIISAIYLVIAYFLDLGNIKDMPLFIISFIFFISLCMSVVRPIRLHYLARRSSNENENRFKVLFAGMLLLIETVCIITSYEYIATKEINIYKGTRIVCQDGTVCFENYIFVGKTQEYLFLYNQIDSATIVVPMSEIKLISFKKSSFMKEIFRSIS